MFDIRPIQGSTLCLDHACGVFDLTLGFAQLCPFELRDEDVLGCGDVDLHTRYDVGTPAFELRSTERTVFPDDEIWAYPGFVDGLVLGSSGASRLTVFELHG